MRAAALFVVLLLSKLAVLAGGDWAESAWSPIAYVWQDAAVALIYAVVDRALSRSPRAAWVVYAVLAGYVAVTVPVFLTLSTPMTWPMWRAARGPLADSIAYYATARNVGWIAAAITAASLTPWVVRRLPRSAVVACLLPIVALGPTASAHVDTRGLERNAWSALVIRLPISVAAAGQASPFAFRAPGQVSPKLASVSDERRRTATSSRVQRTRPASDLSWLRGAGERRNVVLVSLESTAAQYLGLYGASPDVMPNLSRLAESAVVFDHAYAVYPESIKGLFATLCSTYPAFDVPAAAYAQVPCRSPARELAARAYRTALFHSGRFDYLDMNAVIRNRGFERLADAGDIGGNYQSSFGVDEHATVAKILEWIDGLAREDRFFVTYLPIAGHHPYESSRPGPFANGDELGRYRNALHDGDAALGALAAGLQTRGLDRDTIWIVFGDHGEAFGQHRGNYGHTFQLYEENVHVPFLIAAPGLVTHQIRIGGVVSLLDTAPTLLDLVGIPRPDSYEGHSVLEDDRRPAFFFTDYSLRLAGLRDGSMKLIHDLDSGRSRLFDLERDPGELRNVAAADVFEQIKLRDLRVLRGFVMDRR